MRITDITNAEHLIKQGKKENRLIIFYTDTGEKYGSVKFFAVARNWHPSDLSNKFIELTKEYPGLIAGLEGDYIK